MKPRFLNKFSTKSKEKPETTHWILERKLLYKKITNKSHDEIKTPVREDLLEEQESFFPRRKKHFG